MNQNILRAIYYKVRTNYTQRQIAELLEVREETVSRWLKREDVKERLKEEERLFLNDLIPRAIRTQETLLEARSEHVRYLAACDVLDRGGYKPSEKLDLNNKMVVINDDI